MITHEINLKPKSVIGQSLWPWKRGQQQQKPPDIPWFQNIGTPPRTRMGKYEYAKLLTGSPIKKNDLVIFHARLNSQGVPDYANLSAESVYFVNDIQEMHGFVDYNGENKPLPLQLRPVANQSTFWTTIDTWVVVNVNLLPLQLVNQIKSTLPEVYAHSFNTFNTSPPDIEPDPVG